MTRITWDATTSRIYETGVDRGVLYVGVLAGVPWNGLISVKEATIGGIPQPFYMDGLKYSNVSSNEEYSSVIEAYNYPLEFIPCNGMLSMNNGLVFDQQPRSSFGFTYRTKLGNDVSPDLAYKIHIIYNAKAAPSPLSYTSVSGSAEPLLYSWQITTIPVQYNDYKRMSHIIIDTRRTTVNGLAALEDALYGKSAAQPYLPTIAQVVTLLAT